MKKLIYGVLAIAFVVSFSAFTQLPAGKQQDPAANQAKTFTQLVWYYDSNKTSPVGSTADIQTEIQRLENQFPNNTFSQMTGPGLHPYEFGFQSTSDPDADAVIYSDL